LTPYPVIIKTFGLLIASAPHFRLLISDVLMDSTHAFPGKAAEILKSEIINQKLFIHVFKNGYGSQYRVVGLHNWTAHHQVRCPLRHRKRRRGHALLIAQIALRHTNARRY
jgi:hypothetical protein